MPHAGETTGPQTVWDALNELGAERIGHGISAAQDPELLAHLAERQIGMEICPTSNVRTRAVASLDEHPLPQLVEAGLLVTINSDDPPMFGTTLNDEYAVAARLLGAGRGGAGRAGPQRGDRVLPRPRRQAADHRRDRRVPRHRRLSWAAGARLSRWAVRGSGARGGSVGVGGPETPAARAAPPAGGAWCARPVELVGSCTDPVSPQAGHTRSLTAI